MWENEHTDVEKPVYRCGKADNRQHTSVVGLVEKDKKVHQRVVPVTMKQQHTSPLSVLKCKKALVYGHSKLLY